MACSEHRRHVGAREEGVHRKGIQNAIRIPTKRSRGQHDLWVEPATYNFIPNKAKQE